VSGHTNTNVMSLATDTLTLVYPVVTSAKTWITVSLNGTVEWISNVNECGAYVITSCTDSACNSLTTSSDQLRLKTNPTTLAVDVNIKFEYGAGVPSSLIVYLKAETQSLGATPLSKTLEVKVELCDDTATLISSAVE
jgi:hypothetical protein